MKNKKNLMKRVGILLVCLAVLFFAKQVVLADDYDYENMELIPGQERTNNFVQYLENIYTFGIAISAILAFFMMSYGAFVLIFSSVGNASKILDAKDMIASSIFGLVIAVVAFLVLNLINPDLVSGTINKFQRGGVTQKVVNGTVVTGSNKYKGYNEACPKEKQTDLDEAKKPIDFSKAPSQAITTNCNQFDDLFNKFGAELGGNYSGACILKTIAHIESGCKPNVQSGAGACGMMQLLPTTAGVDCDTLKKSPELSVQKATDYIKKNMQGRSLPEILAGYNGGYGKKASGGKIAPLGDSNDCPGAKAFECCINPGGLDESIAYAWNGMGLYNNCVGK